ncbi:MAG: threonine ammonia-lyase, biosynthetic [Kiritimatiellae bacterium]|nr:threonine ammonia-lyase, biosynthetic [Kiritimatiellia bacterium]
MASGYIRRILQARIYDLAVETRIDALPRMSAALGCRVWMKREDLQPIFSFKIRGAYNKMLQLSEAERAGGVIAASAGNHAQGVAISAQHLNAPATIVMPVTTPSIKVDSVSARGARVVLHGDRFDDALARALRIAEEEHLIFLHPYDDPDVIAGQGTVGMEIVRQHTGPLDAIFVPVGGGGLIAGVAAYVKNVRPEIRIIGVEAEDSACLKAAMEAGRRVRLSQVGIFADGVAVAEIGQEPFRIARECVDEVITASTDEICAAVKDVFDDTRSIAEPAGALSLAGLKKYAMRYRNETGGADRHFLAIHSGANVNFDRLRYIAERTELGEKREVLLAVALPEKPGALRAFCESLGDHNITGFNYRYAGAREANILVALSVRAGQETAEKVTAGLNRLGFRVDDLSGNELAKSHVMSMVGGPGTGVDHERLFRFEFPERRGALKRFLELMNPRWNISLFHYRQQGDIYGHVLVGLQVPPDTAEDLKVFLRELDYPYSEATDNPAYIRFLR